MHPKDAAGIANSVDPDQTAPLGAVEEQCNLGRPAQFAHTYLSENVGSLWYNVRVWLTVIVLSSGTDMSGQTL